MDFYKLLLRLILQQQSFNMPYLKPHICHVMGVQCDQILLEMGN